MLALRQVEDAGTGDKVVVFAQSSILTILDTLALHARHNSMPVT